MSQPTTVADELNAIHDRLRAKLDRRLAVATRPTPPNGVVVVTVE